MRRYWIQPTENIDVLEKSVLDFLQIKSLDEQLLPHAARKSTSYAELSPAEQAWLFRARQLQRRKAIASSHSREMLAKVRHIVTKAVLTDGFGSFLATAV